jgi:hypothetical protein
VKTNLSIKAAIYMRAAELVEQGHCKHALARDMGGFSVLPDHDGVVQFCYRGALIKAQTEVSGIPQDKSDFWTGEGMCPTAEELDILITWNNAPDTTAAMVAAKLREQAFA